MYGMLLFITKINMMFLGAPMALTSHNYFLLITRTSFPETRDRQRAISTTFETLGCTASYTRAQGGNPRIKDLATCGCASRHTWRDTSSGGFAPEVGEKMRNLRRVILRSYQGNDGLKGTPWMTCTYISNLNLFLIIHLAWRKHNHHQIKHYLEYLIMHNAVQNLSNFLPFQSTPEMFAIYIKVIACMLSFCVCIWRSSMLWQKTIILEIAHFSYTPVYTEDAIFNHRLRKIT